MEDWKARLILSLMGSWKGIKTNVVIPALHRVGTALTVWMLSRGVPQDPAEQIATGVIALGLVLFDFFADWMSRRAAVAKAKP
jgi:hypothetical protein